MLRDNYISYDTAVLLKEKGFNERICHYYDDEEILHVNTGVYICNSTDFDGCITAPTLAMMIKWLKTKGLYITTQYFKLDVGNDWATVTIYRMNKYGAEIAFEGYDVEELYEKAIKFCCEYLI